jgi:hypothetical protein
MRAPRASTPAQNSPADSNAAHEAKGAESVVATFEDADIQWAVAIDRAYQSPAAIVREHGHLLARGVA